MPWEGDYPKFPGNGTSQCAQRMGLPICSVNGTIQCALGMGLANVLYELD